MGRNATIDAEMGQKLLDAYHRTGNKRQAAADTGVSYQSAKRYLAATPRAAAPVVVQQTQVVERHVGDVLDTQAALQANYARLLAFVETIEGLLKEPGDRPLAAYLATLREVREHVMAGVKLTELLFDAREVQAFQRSVIEAIGEADEPTRERILAKLQERRALGLAVSRP